MEWPSPPQPEEGEELPLWLPKTTRRRTKNLVYIYCWGCRSQYRFGALTFYRGLLVCSSCRPAQNTEVDETSAAEQRKVEAEETYRESIKDGALSVWTIDELDAVTTADLNKGIIDVVSTLGRVNTHQLHLVYSRRTAAAKSELEAARQQSSASGNELLINASKRHQKWYEDRSKLLGRLQAAEAAGEKYVFTAEEASWLKYPGCSRQTETDYEHRRLQLQFIVYMHEYSMQRAEKLFAQAGGTASGRETEILQKWKRLSTLEKQLYEATQRYHVRERKTDVWCRQLHKSATAHIAQELKHAVYFPRKVLIDGHTESLLTFSAKQLTERLKTRESAEDDVKHYVKQLRFLERYGHVMQTPKIIRLHLELAHERIGKFARTNSAGVPVRLDPYLYLYYGAENNYEWSGLRLFEGLVFDGEEQNRKTLADPAIPCALKVHTMWGCVARRVTTATLSTMSKYFTPTRWRELAQDSRWFLPGRVVLLLLIKNRMRRTLNEALPTFEQATRADSAARALTPAWLSFPPPTTSEQNKAAMLWLPDELWGIIFRFFRLDECEFF